MGPLIPGSNKDAHNDPKITSQTTNGTVLRGERKYSNLPLSINFAVSYFLSEHLNETVI